MYLANRHVEDDHDESKETSKHLKKHQHMMIAQSVKIAAAGSCCFDYFILSAYNSFVQTGRELIMNLQDSPTKKIDPKLRKSVERAVRLERSKVVSYELEGVVLDSSVNSMVWNLLNMYRAIASG